jgi:hypothetical protein
VGTLGSVDITAIHPRLVNPFVQHWNLTVEREIVANLGLRLSYIGTRATQLVYGRNINKPPASTQPFAQSRRPYPLYRNITMYENGGSQIYNSFTAEVQRRFSRGLSFQAAWTWAKNLTDADEVGITEGGPTIEDTYNRRRERGNAQFTPRHRFVSNAIWQLPFGKGRTWMNSGGPLDWVFGGWQLSAVYNAQTGEYFTPTFSGPDPSNTQTFGGIPDRIGSGELPAGERSIRRWFDATAFRVPAAGSFGNSGWNILAGPGRHAANLGVFKTFQPTERVAVRVQATFTNAFNHPNFGAPNTNISAPASAGTITGVQTRDSGGPRQGLLAIFLTF